MTEPSSSPEDECIHGIAPVAACSICKSSKRTKKASTPTPRTGESSRSNALSARELRACPRCDRPASTNVSTCPRCGFVLRSDLVPAQPIKQAKRREVRRWIVRYPLRDWQISALNAWELAGCKGVVEAATATGKTAVALAAIERLHQRHGDDLRIAVVVPTIVLRANGEVFSQVK